MSEKCIIPEAMTDVEGRCRICLMDYGPLYFPCKCTGSVGIHEECFT